MVFNQDNQLEKFLNVLWECPRCLKKTVRQNPDTKLFECSNKLCKARYTLLEITRPLK